MREFNNKRPARSLRNSGFTLIEILVVLIIIGILAAIALPNLFSNVNKSRGAEALGALSGFKSTVEACVQGHYSTSATNCVWTTLLGTGAGTQGNFYYTYTTVPANSTYAYGLKATSRSLSSDTLILTRDTVAGTYTCTGAGNFISSC